MPQPPPGSVRDSRDDTLNNPQTPDERFTKEQARDPSFQIPPSPRKLSTITSVSSSNDSSERYMTPLGARFDPQKSTRKSQCYKFKIGDRVEVRDDPFQPWQRGVVDSLQSDGRPRVLRESGTPHGVAFPFNECRKILESVTEAEAGGSLPSSRESTPPQRDGARGVLRGRRVLSAVEEQGGGGEGGEGGPSDGADKASEALFAALCEKGHGVLTGSLFLAAVSHSGLAPDLEEISRDGSGRGGALRSLHVDKDDSAKLGLLELRLLLLNLAAITGRSTDETCEAIKAGL